MENPDKPAGAFIDKLLQAGANPSDSELGALSNLSPQNLASFVKQWRGSDIVQRLRLVSRLVELAENDFTLDFTSVFVACAGDPDERIRVKVIQGLELEDKHTCIKPIIGAVRTDESEDVRAAAASALGKYALMAELDELPDAMADEIFSALIAVLENPREPISVKKRALESVSVFQREPVDNYIEDYYYSEDPSVKAGAIFAMGRNCKTRWISFLIDELQSTIPEFRYEAARASGEIEDEEAVPYLVNLVEDEDREVQEAAIGALGKIGGSEAKHCLQELSEHTDPGIRESAAAALAGLTSCEDPLSLNF
jgi:HEAT repeat protein